MHAMRKVEVVPLEMTATISACGLYRYRLERDLFPDGEGSVAVIMVNPSTADATKDDATITRIRRRFMKAEYLSKLLPRPAKVIVGNLFAFRATDIRVLASAADAIGPDNDEQLWRIALEADRLVYGWGPLAKMPAPLRGRWRQVHDLFMASGKHIPSIIGRPAQDGQPRHPLMLGYDEPLVSWNVPI